MPKPAIVYPEILGHKFVVTAIDGNMVTLTSVADDGEGTDARNGVAHVPFDVERAGIKVGDQCYLKWQFRRD